MNSLSIRLDATEVQQVSALNFFINCNIYDSRKVLDQYFEIISDNSNELSKYLPYMSDYRHLGERTKSLASGRPKISFITSMFNAGAYLPSFLENIHSAAVNSNGEIILIDVNKHDNDEKIVLKYIKDNFLSKNLIRYVRLDKDPGLYKTWEHGINISNSDIITNANVDDKRSTSHTKILTEFLLNSSEYAGACGSIWGSREGPHERYSSVVNGEAWFYENQKFDIEFSDLWVMDGDLVKSRNIMHCIPVWRKKLHEKYGFFQEDIYGTSADWAFWLKCTKGGEIFRHINHVFGRYYINPNSHNRINDSSGSKELRIINEIIEYKQEKLIKQ
jgi:hypothetical protein